MTVALYRHFDARGALLYVGISLSAVQRLSEHSRHSCWAKNIAHVTVEWFDTRGGAIAAEAAAIRSEHPLHNKIHNVEVRAGRVVPGRRLEPEVPQIVHQPEAVAVFFKVSVGVVSRMIANGMPRTKIGPRKYEYDLSAIKAWTRRNAEIYNEKLAQKRMKKEVTQEQMFEALSKIGQKR